MIIKRLRVENYLSLKEVEVELGQRNILVGPNMSGKSNLVDCFRFLTHMVVSGLSKAFLDRGGFSEVVWKGGDASRISFQLMSEDRSSEQTPGRVYQYEISIIGSTTTNLFLIERESLVVQAGNQVSTLMEISNGQGQMTHEDGTTRTYSPGPTTSAFQLTVPNWEGTIMKEFLSSWRFYRLIPAMMKQANAAIGQTFLSESGDNLSSWLMTLQTRHPEEFRRIKQVAVDILPGLEELLTSPTQFATTYVTTREKHLKRPINIWRMSDGELNFLALLSLIFAPPELGAPLYCVEEPENHLHPRLLETLVEILTQRQAELNSELGFEGAQIIVTTHSPYLVDRVNLDELIVVEKSNGATRCTRPASKKHLRELLEREELGLGELWYSGALSED